MHFVQQWQCTIGVVPAMADDVTTITYWVNDRHDSEYMTEMVEKYNKENTDNIYIDMQIITDDYENMISLAYTGVQHRISSDRA